MVMGDYGVQKLRLGGVGGEWSFLIGDIAEVEQWTFPVHFYICPKCGKVEMEVANPENVLLSRKFLKKCVKCGEKIPLASEQCQYCGAEQTKKREK
jgi:predicted RNA-binding Zn-ribbon protein involved in translation (DUF1610 family)